MELIEKWLGVEYVMPRIGMEKSMANTWKIVIQVQSCYTSCTVVSTISMDWQCHRSYLSTVSSGKRRSLNSLGSLYKTVMTATKTAFLRLMLLIRSGCRRDRVNPVLAWKNKNW